jgi:hypothetical protein
LATSRAAEGNSGSLKKAFQEAGVAGSGPIFLERDARASLDALAKRISALAAGDLHGKTCKDSGAARFLGVVLERPETVLSIHELGK